VTGETHFGLTGLAVVGANLARNVASHGIPIAVHNRTVRRTERFMADHGDEGPITGAGPVEEFVPAGAAAHGDGHGEGGDRPWTR
jgi:6-phosphogluconate dehydrogenase